MASQDLNMIRRRIRGMGGNGETRKRKEEIRLKLKTLKELTSATISLKSITSSMKRGRRMLNIKVITNTTSLNNNNSLNNWLNKKKEKINNYQKM